MPAARDYFVALSPEEVIDAIKRQADVHFATGRDRREIADVLTKRSFVATSNSQQAMAIYATRPNDIAGIGAGFLGRVQLRLQLEALDEGTQVVCRFEHSRSVQSSLRWLGLVATSLVGLAWVLVGGGSMVQRALLFAAFSLFVVPVLLYDIARLRGSPQERVALLDLVQRALGPAVIGDGPLQRMPFRRSHALPRGPTKSGSGEASGESSGSASRERERES
ncbi:MAG: hypothetical protein B7733_09135 [Myxococcales bacterium FL481]|nr:MAG: hypothetical protein B7733_09135 [Myxococcales bacterium FL481]